MVTQPNRRTFLGASAAGVGATALAGLSPLPAEAAGPGAGEAAIADRLCRIRTPTRLRRDTCTAVELVRAHTDRIDTYDDVYQTYDAQTTTANSTICADFVPVFDATAYARLKAAGEIMLGKGQMGPLATTGPPCPTAPSPR